MKPYYNTISDPLYPLFRNDGLPASHALYEARLSQQYRQFDKERQQSSKLDKKSKKVLCISVHEKTKQKLKFKLSLEEERGEKERV